MFLHFFFQLLFINIHYKRVNHIYDSFRKAYRKFALHCQEEKKMEFDSVNKRLRKQFRIYTAICFITSMIWSITGFIDPVTEKDHVLQRIEIENFSFKYGINFWLPFVIRSRFQFYIVTFLLNINLYELTWVFCGIDCIQVSLLGYLSGHLQILGKEIEKSSECKKHSMEENLIRCVQYHKELFR